MTTDLATLGIAVDSTQVRRGVSDLDGLAAAGGRAEKSVQSLGGVVGALARGMGVLTGALATVGISRLITETATLSQRYNEMGIVLNVVSRNAGLLKSDVDAVTKAVKDQGISMIESRSVMTRLIQAQIDLSKATELARLAQDAAVIGQINSSEALDRMIHGITSAQVEVLRGIGINVNFENSYKQLAQQMGVATSSLSEQQKMQARVNIVLEEATKLNGVYAASMENAGKQMRSTQRLAEDLKVKIGGLFDQTAMVAVKAYTDLLKDLDRTVEDMARSGELKDWSHRIAIEFAGLIDITRVFIGQFGIIGNLVATQFTNIKNGDFDKLSLGFANADKALKALWADGEKYQDQVNSRVIQENMLTEAVGRGAAAAQKKSEEEAKGALGLKGRKSEQDKLNKAQQEALRIESEYIKLLEIERKQRQDLIAPYKESAKQAADRLVDMQDEITALKLVRDRQISMKQAVELTTIARLEEKKAKATDSLVLKEIDAEIAARRKVIDLIPEYDRLQNSSGNAANQVSQQWIQAGRNIQSALSNSIFDFFNDGLDGMVRNLKSAVLRMLAEFAALKISESIGSMLLGSGVGIASGVAGGGSMNLSSGLAGVGGTGAGANRASFLGRTGMSSGQIMSMASMAGPYGAAAAAAVIALNALDKKYGGYKLDGFHKGIAGFTSAMTQPTFLMDKGIMEVEKLFGTNFVSKATPTHFMRKTLGISPIEEIIGKALFGRGPYKFRQQSIQGDITAGGLDGSITDVYKSKGGLLVGTKHKSFDGDIPSEIIRDVDKSIKKIYTSTHEFAVNLGMDANLVDTFTKEIQVKSDKNKTLTTEQIGEMLKGLQDEIATNVMPSIDAFKLTGETAGQTFTRLSNELDALKTGVQNLGGSAALAKELIMGMSIDARSAVVDIAGGIDKLLEKTQFFSENFLTPTEQLAPTIAMVNEEMAKLGFSSVTTKDQFRELVQSMEIPAETRNALLDIAPAFLQILDAAKQIKAEANQNMLTLAQEFAPQLVIGLQRDMANEVLGKFGVTVDTSREKVTELLTAFVKSGGLFSNMADDVMEAAAAWSGFQQLIAQTPASVSAQALPLDKQADNAMAMLLKSVDAERNKLTLKYNDAVKISNDRITAVTESVNKLKNASDMVKSTVNDIIPMSLEQARSQIANGAADSSNLADALNVLRNQNDTSGFSNVLEFRRSQGQNANILNKFSNSVESQLTLEQRSLAALEASRKSLDDNFKLQNDNLDQLIVDAQAQVEHLKGIFINTVDLNTAIGELNRILLQGGKSAVGGGAVSGGKPPVSGNLDVSSADIVGYITTHSYMESYKKARELGVTSAQIAATGIFSQQQINDWVKQQGLASFDVGGRVPKTGIAMIHKDEQILTKSQSDDMNKTLAMLVTTVQALTISNNQMKRIFQTWDGNGMPPVREVDEAA